VTSRERGHHRLRPLVSGGAGGDGHQTARRTLSTNEQIIRAWVREGIIPAHRKPGGRKFTFLRHEIFDWLIANRYEPN
jgi:hypothetical protein